MIRFLTVEVIRLFIEQAPSVRLDLPKCFVILALEAPEQTFNVYQGSFTNRRGGAIARLVPDFDSVPLGGLLPLTSWVLVALMSRDSEVSVRLTVLCSS